MRLIDADKLLHEVKMSTKLIAESRNATARNVVKKVLYIIEYSETVDAEPVRHGKWLLKAYKEPSNYRWNVKAECSECCDEEKEIWAGFFPNVPDWLARDVAIQCAEEVKMSNYCPNCGAKMDGDEQWQNF